MSWILIVDDKELVRDSVGVTLARRGHRVVAVADGAAALTEAERRPIDVVVTDLQMPGIDGLELLERLRSVDEHLPVILMTAYGTVETAVAALKRGAYDYVTKPFSGDEIVLAVDRAIEHRRLRRENEVLRASGAAPGEEPVIGVSPACSALRERLERLAESHGTVLITGESGSGKEVAARWIHAHSRRNDKPFLAVNCAAIATSLLESELFGHERGAFTGADRTRRGRFELADGGTLLLDEISEIDPSIQAKLLRVLQEQAYERVGSSRTRRIDVRIIATSNRDLPAEVRAGRFREDLFFRLNVLPLEVPPLREHPQDIAPLARHFLRAVAEREGRPVRHLEPKAIEVMDRYRWPGNVRELRNICERAFVLAPDERITAELIRPWLGDVMPAAPAVSIEVNGGPTAAMVCDGRQTLDDVERAAIVATLEHYDGHRRRSAAALGIGLRTLSLKIKKWKEERVVSSSL